MSSTQTTSPVPAAPADAMSPRSTAPSSPAALMVIAPALAGAAVAVALGVYGRVHDPSGGAITTLGFPSMVAMKVWLATAAFVLALAQLTSALWMYGRLPFGRPPRRLGFVHRWSGTAAFLVSLPVAYHCLWSLGFQPTGARRLAHSLFGCAFYGAFATKLLVLRAARAPKWAVPVAGSLLVTCLTGLWLTSALWFFTTVGLPT
jgi:hypothetical protein